MSKVSELLKYQEVDKELRKIEQEIAASEERKKFIQAKKFIESALEKLEAYDKRAVDLKHTRDEISARVEDLGKALAEYSDLEEMLEDDGAVSFYKKNALALSDKLRAVKGELQKLVSDIENASEEYKKLKEQTKAMQKQYKEYNEKFKELKGSRSAELTEITKKLEAIAKNIPADIIAKYDAKRKERVFPVLVPLTAGGCICGMEFSLAQKEKLAGGNVIECEHCRRLVYNPAE
ncbi:MAG: hypothetical protein K2N74_03055 [Clostridiales bacterium]|nr:hypothetical protein [Clostridiales bacterium]